MIVKGGIAVYIGSVCPAGFGILMQVLCFRSVFISLRTLHECSEGKDMLKTADPGITTWYRR